MNSKIGNGVAILAAVVAIVVVIAGQPLVLAIGVALAGALFGTIIRARGSKNRSGSVGIR